MLTHWDEYLLTWNYGNSPGEVFILSCPISGHWYSTLDHMSPTLAPGRVDVRSSPAAPLYSEGGQLLCFSSKLWRRHLSSTVVESLTLRSHLDQVLSLNTTICTWLSIFTLEISIHSLSACEFRPWSLGLLWHLPQTRGLPNPLFSTTPEPA